MSWGRKQAAGSIVPVSVRWRQVYSDGEVALHPFTKAEVDAVTLDHDAVPPAERGPFLQAISPELASSLPASGSAGTRSAAAVAAPYVPGAQPRPESAGDPRADPVTALERLGFVRPGSPAVPDGPILNEFAGWTVPGRGPSAARPVALAGDLAIITRIRCQPIFVAEIFTAPDPVRVDIARGRWRLLARLYAPYRLPVCLVERPAGPDGELSPYLLLRDDQAIFAMMGWCGADIATFQEQLREQAVGSSRPGRPAASVPAAGSDREPVGADGSVPGQRAVPTAGVAAGFTGLAQLFLSHARERQVVLQSLVVASRASQLWLLDGEHLERAVAVSVGEFGARVDALLQTASASGAARPP